MIRDDPHTHVATMTIALMVQPWGIEERIGVTAENNQGENMAVPVLKTMIELLDKHRTAVGLQAAEQERHEAISFRADAEDGESITARRVGVLLGADSDPPERRRGPQSGHNAGAFLRDAGAAG